MTTIQNLKTFGERPLLNPPSPLPTLLAKQSPSTISETTGIAVNP